MKAGKSKRVGGVPRALDQGILGSFAILALIGFAALWSSSSGYAIRQGWTAGYFAARQAFFLLGAVAAFALLAFLPLESVRKFSGIIAIASLASLLLPFVPHLGVEINGARRWIGIGFMNLQPSEFWKVASVFYLAHILDRRREEIRSSAVEAIMPFALVVAATAIIYFQDDFSTAALSLLAAMTLFWFAGAKLRFFLGVLTIAVPALAIMVMTSEYRLNRILGFIIPEFDPHGMNYQVMNSIAAIVSGGFWGKGIGLGTRKIDSIPEIQSDFVFAGFVEETGLFGVIIVFLCWGFIGYRVLKATKGRSDFKALLALGYFSLLFMQFLVNLGVVSGFLPATGIALPFFSAGGSSLISTAIACGFLVNALSDRGFEPVREADISGSRGGIVHG